MLPVDSSFGALLVGAVISYALYGITCGQVLGYYRSTKSDHWTLRGMVAAVCVMDTLQQCLLMHTLWYYFVSKCDGDPSGYLFTVWSFSAFVIPGALSNFIVEICLIMRIRSLTGMKFGFVLLVPAFAALAASIVFSGQSVVSPALTVQTQLAKFTFVAAFTSYVVTDTAIAVIICGFLRRQQHNAIGPLRLVVRLVINYTIVSGLLPTLLVSSALICYLKLSASGSMVYVALYLIHSKLYVITMLASLNNRQAMRSRLQAVKVF